MPEKDLQGSSAQIEQIGIMLAEAFIARVERFPPEERIKLLKACRQHLETSPDVARIFFIPE